MMDVEDPKTYIRSNRADCTLEGLLEYRHTEIDDKVCPIDFVLEVVKNELNDAGCRKLSKKYKIPIPSKPQMIKRYRQYFKDSSLTHPILRKKPGKSESGVLVITVLTSPKPEYQKYNDKTKKEETVVQKFSCKYNCYYCPNEPGQPRSYLFDEPAVIRANACKFCPILQFIDRATALDRMGHPVDKIELIVLGGTWSNYPKEYQDQFVRDLFYASNCFFDDLPWRKPLSLKTEQMINESAKVKIIGLTLETRPDEIIPSELHRLRYLGCTRVQIGVQHTNNAILKKINRGCTDADTINAIQDLKNSCFKLDAHLMPNLPGSSPKIDLEMLLKFCHDSRYQVDQLKIYPCETLPWTVLKKWFDQKIYKPYPETDLIEVLIVFYINIKWWQRLNRMVRDIPKQYIFAGTANSNLRQSLEEVLRQRGLKDNNIRAREVGRLMTNKKKYNQAVVNAIFKVREYQASNGLELFLSFESEYPDALCAFLRLRLCQPDITTFPELDKCALIRELHTYGQLITTKSTKKGSQHCGFGKRLVSKAIRMSIHNGYYKIAVISGIGTRNYYRKLGFYLAEGRGEFMIYRATTLDIIEAYTYAYQGIIIMFLVFIIIKMMLYFMVM